MQRGVQSRCLHHGLCDGCGLVRGQTAVEIVVAAVVAAVVAVGGTAGAVLHEPGLVVNGRAVHHFRRRRSLLRAVNDFCWRRSLVVGLFVLGVLLFYPICRGLWQHPRGQGEAG